MMLLLIFSTLELPEEFIKILDSEIEINEKARDHLLLLKKHLQYYDPERLSLKCLRNHYTSNIAEGIFAKIKDWLDHKIAPLYEIINCFVRESLIMMKRNIKTNAEPMPLEIYIGRKLGYFANDFLIKTFKDLKHLININDSLDANEWEDCDCGIKGEYNLPCIHKFIVHYKKGDRPLFTENDIPNIYFKSNLLEKTESSIKVLKPINRDNLKYTYQNIMDMVSPIAAEAERNPNVHLMFKSLFERFSELKLPAIEGSPPSLQTPGRQITRQSKFVDHHFKSGRKKTKRTYRCSICHETGHNAAFHRKHV